MQSHHDSEGSVPRGGIHSIGLPLLRRYLSRQLRAAMQGGQRLAWLAVCSCALSAMCGRDDAIAPAARVGAAGACRTEGLLQLRGGSSAGVLEMADKVAAGEALPPLVLEADSAVGTDVDVAAHETTASHASDEQTAAGSDGASGQGQAGPDAEGAEALRAQDGGAGGGVKTVDKMTLCWECGAERPEMECAMCGRARFCSTECQKAQWPRHRDACRSLRPRDRVEGPFPPRANFEDLAYRYIAGDKAARDTVDQVIPRASETTCAAVIYLSRV